LSSEDYRYFYNKFYRKIYNDISSPNDEYFNQRLGVAKKLLLQINKKKTINNSSVLDVGCSSGSLVNMVNDFGGYGEGLDLNEDFIAFGLSKGLSLFVGTIHDLDNTKKYDIVVYRHVFEHIADINLELEKIYDLLNPNGLLYIEVPGLLNLHASYRLNIREYHQNAHIHHFTASDLKNALSKHGLMVIECNEEIKCYARKSETTKIEFTRNYLHNTQYISRLKWRRWFLYVFSNYGRKSVLMIAKKWLRFIKRIFSKNRYYIVK
jgi:2-polyprenyl-3-methyl-5-hydroxy-6-metoxy-1,4-benzoquinol methylase